MQLTHARAKQRDDPPRDARGHIGVAVAVAAHPARDLNRRRVGRERCEAVILEEAVETAVVRGHGIPERLFDDGHAVARLALGCRFRAAHRGRAPRREQLALDRPRDLLELARGAGGGKVLMLLEKLDDACEARARTGTRQTSESESS